jgi:hypothetical protein
MQTSVFLDDLDRPVRGAKAIAEVLNLRDKNGEPDARKAFHALERGYVDGSKMGRQWWSTPRRLLGLPRENRVA